MGPAPSDRSSPCSRVASFRFRLPSTRGRPLRRSATDQHSRRLKQKTRQGLRRSFFPPRTSSTSSSSSSRSSTHW